LVTLLVLEGLVRLLNLQTASYNSISGFCQYDPELGWTLVPDQRTVFKGRHFTALVETNAEGLRDRHYAFERESGRKRILVLGDSVAWCWGVEMNSCFTKLIESELGDTDVITMGVPGYSSAQELLLYEREGRRYGADLVLLVFTGNDAVDNLDARKRPRFILTPEGLVLTNQPVERRKSRLKSWLRLNSKLFVQLDFGSQVGQEWLKRLRKRSAAPERKTAPPTRFVMPSESEEVGSLPLTEAILNRLHAQVTADGAAFAIVSFTAPESFVRSLDAFCASRGCGYLDTASAFEGGRAAGLEIFIPADGHLAPDGQVILAELILELLEERGLDPALGAGPESDPDLAAETGFR
jgi:lysophospholipase L1-like esterase